MERSLDIPIFVGVIGEWLTTIILGVAALVFGGYLRSRCCGGQLEHVDRESIISQAEARIDIARITGRATKYESEDNEKSVEEVVIDVE